jgi:hypothetical protein
MGWASMILDGIARVIVQSVNAAGKTQLWKIEDEAPDENEDGDDLLEVESFQHFGFASNPPAGAEAIVANVGADSAHPVVVASQHKDYQPRDLKEGEVALYTLDGVLVYCREDGITYVGGVPDGDDDPAFDFPALAQKVLDELQSVKADLQAVISSVSGHSHPVATSGTATAQTGATTGIVYTAPTPHTPASVACTKLKTK